MNYSGRIMYNINSLYDVIPNFYMKSDKLNKIDENYYGSMKEFRFKQELKY